jgi:hypothetical protein
MGYDNLKRIIQEAVADQSKVQQINDVIATLSKITFPVDDKTLQAIADKLHSVGINPVDIVASKGKMNDPNTQKQYLITGPSAPGGGGNGALNDLKIIVKQ